MLEREGMQFAPCIWPVPSASSRCISPHQPLTVTKLVDTPLISQVLITGVVDDCEPAYTSLTSNWTITLRAGERNFSVSVAVAVTAVTVDVAMVGISIYLADPISVGIYDEGTLFTQGQTFPYFPSSSRGAPPRVYSVGREASLDVTGITAGAATNLSTVLLSSDGSNWFSWGVQLLLAGAFPAGLVHGLRRAWPRPMVEQLSVSDAAHPPTWTTLRRSFRSLA